MIRFTALVKVKSIQQKGIEFQHIYNNVMQHIQELKIEIKNITLNIQKFLPTARNAFPGQGHERWSRCQQITARTGVLALKILFGQTEVTVEMELTYCLLPSIEVITLLSLCYHHALTAASTMRC
ncbi:hypothetical protein PR048_028363 [Dryococelus australis]|uniref:Uncharacterized protein n=1 Tax=Dryococelus australis TaxID=614101 RepID=A0ABQ9GJ26_9NEOP|nr:hypothetical protein PR048_028363 [Dryococelus australis]